MSTFARNEKILYVDDEPDLLTSFSSTVESLGLEVSVLEHSCDIESILLTDGPFALVLSDQRMPEFEGVEVLHRVAILHPETIRILVTGYSDYEDTLRAINDGGISRYITKPWDQDNIRAIIVEGVDRYNLAAEVKFVIGELREKNDSLRVLLDGTVTGVVGLLGDVLGYVNPAAATESAKFAKLGCSVLDAFPELSSAEKWEIARALELVNLGLAVLPPWVQIAVQKNDLIGLDRFPVARNHRVLAAALLDKIPRFENVARILRLSGKEFDGSGEPSEESVFGTYLPFGSRLIHILDHVAKDSTQNFKGRVVLESMIRHTTKYDITIIQRLLGIAGSTKQQREADIQISRLEPGMIVLVDVLTNDGKVLLRAPATLNHTSVNVMKQWNERDPITSLVRVRFPDSHSG